MWDGEKTYAFLRIPPSKFDPLLNLGIQLLIQRGRFAAEAQGSTDIDDILACVQKSMRNTCALHGLLGSVQYILIFLEPLHT